MLDFLPIGKNHIYVKTRGFPGCKNESVKYEFGIACRTMPFELSIPGDGPDNRIPWFREQENWIDGLTDIGIEKIWDCLWQIKNETALRQFLQRLEPFRIETKYY